MAPCGTLRAPTWLGGSGNKAGLRRKPTSQEVLDALRKRIDAAYAGNEEFNTEAARFLDQCGSDQVRFTRSPPRRSAHSGLIPAFCRAHSREVSTSSAAIGQLTAFRRSGRFKVTTPTPWSTARSARSCMPNWPTRASMT